MALIAISGLVYRFPIEYQENMDRNSELPSIDELARKLAESVPAGLRSMREELEQNFRATLRTALHRLELVTREEFEVQRLVLARTREKLDAMSERLEQLEAEATRDKAPAKKKKARQGASPADKAARSEDDISHAEGTRTNGSDDTAGGGSDT